MRDAVDAACREAGRDPAEVARTVTVLVAHDGRQGPVDLVRRSDAAARRHATRRRWPRRSGATRDQGISHVQLVLDPITVESIQECAPILAALDRG